MRRFLTSLLPAAALLGIALPAQADPVVVELFASQNCAACPKAHATMATINTLRDDVLILTWSVDYWDYLGEKDPMAMPEAKARQAAYVERFGLRGPYTPQSVYDGEVQCPGNKVSQVRRNIDTQKSGDPAGLTLSHSATDVLTVSGKTAAEIMHVTYLPADAHATGMVNPVTSIQKLGTYDGQTARFTLPDCTATCAILAQTTDFGTIHAALVLSAD